MAAMANTLPQSGFGTNGAHPATGQRRYNNMPSPMMPQMQHMHPQYNGQPNPQMSPIATNHGYYAQQHHMHQYYSANQMSPTQSHTPMQPRQAMPYYSNALIMNQHDPAFYYSQPGQYTGQPMGMAGAMIHGQYLPSIPAIADSRGINRSPDGVKQQVARSQNRGQGGPTQIE